jgi:CRP/FNR family transcriptional regulator
LEALAAAEPAVRRYLDAAITGRIARQAIHAVSLGQFDCEQRVATLLIELALRTARPSPGAGVTFEMPFSRKDIADYLGLNPDTLSRVVSRLKTAGLIGHPVRSRIMVRDLAALAARSPAAQSLIEIGVARGQDRPLGTTI